MQNSTLFTFVLIPALVDLAQPTAKAVAAQDPSASGHGNLRFGEGLRTFSSRSAPSGPRTAP
jgi:hypothetical protein